MNDLALNIAARQRAEAVIELCEAETCNRFWEELTLLASKRLPPKPAPVDPFAPMDEQEAIRFEAVSMPYGVYVGNSIGLLDVGYIGWLAENDFAIKLRRYVKSERFKRRQEEETE